VRLLLAHPRILKRSCADCQTWLYDDNHRRVLRLGEPVARPQGAPTPCWRCPKKSPEHARPVERALPKITRTINLYFQVRGTAGQCLSPAERNDRIIRRNLGIVEVLVTRAERESFSAAMKESLRRE